ncbi:AraC family transcriptional regulator [Nocardia uniformis]|nr:helix-turn-helix domain-containing protein [Nocardia uniformis]
MLAPARNADLLESPLPVPESLRPWFAELGRIAMVTDTPQALFHIPQVTTTIMLQTEISGRGAAFVIGPQTRASYWTADRPGGCLRIRLAPGTTRQLLGISTADLADRMVHLGDMPGAVGELADELLTLPSDEVVPFLEAALPQRISETSTQRAHRDLLRSAVEAITGSAGTPVPDLAADLAVSERQLRNLFNTGIGLSPKHFGRISRVRQVIAHGGSTPWAEVASTAGFYDQSHLSADFRSLMGVPPAMFFRGDLPAPAHCRNNPGRERYSSEQAAA